MNLRVAGIGLLAFSLLIPPFAWTQDQPPKAATHDLIIEAPPTLAPGTRAAMRIGVYVTTGLFQARPAKNAAVRVVLIDGKGLARELYRGKTDAHGNAAVGFVVPNLPEGEYALEITTESDAGKDVRTRKIQLVRGARVLLTTDKPLYQPGQCVHIRALALDAIRLRPVAGTGILFEIEDSRGNKVFKKLAKTSEFGVASLDFQLASEVLHGAYRLRATLGKVKAEKSFEVKPYVLPKFKVEIRTDKNFYRPLETVKGSLSARYFFGKPVAGAPVTVRASTFDVQLREFAKLDLETNGEGTAEFELKLPGYFVGQPLDGGNAFVLFDVEVIDAAEHTERAQKRVTVCSRPVLLYLLPESGRLVGGVENRVYVVAATPNGEPVEADLTVQVGGTKTKVRTNASGYATFTFVPKPEAVKSEWDWRREKETLYFDAEITARMEGGETVVLHKRLEVEPGAEGLLLRADKAVYRTGESIVLDLFSRTPAGTVFIDVSRGGQIHSTHALELEKGRGRLVIPIPPDLFGSVEIQAYRISARGEISRDTRIVFIEPRNGLRVKIDPDQQVYRPGSEAKIRFHVTNEEGQGVRAALGILVVDEAVYALQDMQPGLAKAYFMLEQEILKPKVQIKFGPGLPQLVTARAPRQEVAKILLANVDVPQRRWKVNTVKERFDRARKGLAKLLEGLLTFVAENVEAPANVTRRNPFTDKRELRPDLIRRMTDHRKEYRRFARDPWGRPVTLETLEQAYGVDLFDYFTHFFSRGAIGRIFHALTRSMLTMDVVEQDHGRWRIADGLLERLVEKTGLRKMDLRDCWGDPITEERLAGLSPVFDPENLAKLTDDERRAALFEILVRFIAGGGRWSDDVIERAGEALGLPKALIRSVETGKTFTIEQLRKRWPAFGKEVVEREALVERSGAVWDTLMETVRREGIEAIAQRTERGFRLRDDALKVAGVPEGARVDPERLRSDPFFRMDLFALTALMRNWRDLVGLIRIYSREKNLYDRRQWVIRPPKNLIDRMLKDRAIPRRWVLTDPFTGKRFRVYINPDRPFCGWGDLRHIDFVSAGPDGRFGTKDDIRLGKINYAPYDRVSRPFRSVRFPRDPTILRDPWLARRGMISGWGPEGFGFGAKELDRAMPRRKMINRAPVRPPLPEAAGGPGGAGPETKRAESHREPARVRNWFPETLFWKPELITDESGRAELTVPIADSITTWRLTCTASGKGCGLGSATRPLRVFQDFFADIDFPVKLTRNDLIWVPVAVYNYMKESQKVKLVVEQAGWFELLDDAEKVIEIAANEIRPVYFKIRAKRVGRHAFTVKAYGTRLSDALEKSVEVVPDGKRVEQVVNGKLPKRAEHSFTIPPSAIEGASKILFKVYPGVLAQIVEGLEGLLRLPGG